MSNETYYKVLRRRADGTLRSCHGGDAIWPEPTRIGFSTYAPGEPVMAHVAVDFGHAGIHLTTAPLAWLTVMGAECYLAEPIGPVRGRRDDKAVFDGARLLEPVEIPWWWQEVEAFVASIPATPWMQRIAPAKPEWRVFPTMAASRDAYVADYWAASGDASRNAYYWSAYWSACWAAFGDASRDASRDAPRDASRWAAVRAATRDASGDAALLAQCLVCGGLPLDPRHLAHARARWDVWQRGYGLFGDVDGVLYVYEAVE